MDKIRVLIVDDMEEIRNHFTKLLNKNDKIEVIGEAKSGSEAVEKAMLHKPDVILMDIQMETDRDGIDASIKILEEFPETKIIILTIYDTRQNVLECYDNGIFDFLSKNIDSEEIILSILNSQQQDNTQNKVNQIVKEEMISLRKSRDSLLYCVELVSRLSKKELEVLKLLCNDKKYREIADIMNVEETTIRTIVSRISKKISNDTIRSIIAQFKKNGIADFLKYF